MGSGLSWAAVWSELLLCLGTAQEGTGEAVHPREKAQLPLAIAFLKPAVQTWVVSGLL